MTRSSMAISYSREELNCLVSRLSPQRKSRKFVGISTVWITETEYEAAIICRGTTKLQSSVQAKISRNGFPRRTGCCVHIPPSCGRVGVASTCDCLGQNTSTGRRHRRRGGQRSYRWRNGSCCETWRGRLSARGWFCRPGNPAPDRPGQSLQISFNDKSGCLCDSVGAH